MKIGELLSGFHTNRKSIVEKYLQLPVSEAITLFKEQDHDPELQLEMREAILEVRESCFRVIQDTAFKPGGNVEEVTPHEEAWMKRELGWWQKAYQNKGYTVAQAVEAEIQNTPAYKSIWDGYSEKEKGLFNAKKDAYSRKIDPSLLG